MLFRGSGADDAEVFMSSDKTHVVPVRQDMRKVLAVGWWYQARAWHRCYGGDAATDYSSGVALCPEYGGPVDKGIQDPETYMQLGGRREWRRGGDSSRTKVPTFPLRFSLHAAFAMFTKYLWLPIYHKLALAASDQTP